MGGGDGTIERLHHAAPRTSPCLQWIDPYGDTIFNAAQSGALVAELQAAALTLSGDDRRSVEGLVELAQRCADGTHLYVWCVGD
jgi:hypothetical protein